MKKIIYIFLILLISCHNLKAQPNSTNKNQEQPQANLLNEDQERLYYYPNSRNKCNENLLR
jgi:hypothetical protein